MADLPYLFLFLDKAGRLFNFVPRPRFYPYPSALPFSIMGSKIIWGGRTMSKEYIITCESTADLTAVSAKETGIPVLQQYFRIGEEHLEDTAEEQAERYQRCLAALRRGISPVAVKTGFSQYLILFAELIEQYDVIHIAPSGALSSSYSTATEVASLLMQVNSGTSIQVVDSLCTSAGYGMLVQDAAEQKRCGLSRESMMRWLQENRGRYHHVLFTENLHTLQREDFMERYPVKSHVLDPFTLFCLNEAGELTSFSRAHNEKKAVEQSIFYISRSYGMKHPGPDKCVVYHCDNKAGAEKLQNAIELCFPHLSGKVPVLPMGAVTSCCCGPGAVAVSFAAEI